MPDHKPARRRYWIIANRENGRIRILTIVPANGERVLPVFSFREEAEMYVRCEAPGIGWTASETTAGELISFLCGLCSAVRAVALDPLPEVLSRDMIRLVSLDRKSFLKVLLENAPSAGPTPGSRRAPRNVGAARSGVGSISSRSLSRSM